jgi:hypothetical protein
MTIPFDLDYDIYSLSLNLSHAKKGSRTFDKLIAKVFGRSTTEPWSTRFEKAADLFKEEFGTQGWSRECLYNSCNGISWHVRNDETGEWFPGHGDTDALALCVAIVKAKRGETEE